MIIKAHPRITFGYKPFKLVNRDVSKNAFDSIFILVKDLYDEVHVTKSDKLSIEYLGSNQNSYQSVNDFIIKGLLYFQTHFSIDINLKIVIQKKVPLNSGLASSESCAAAVFKYLIQEHNLPVSLFNLATKIGSNIPFFVSGYEIARVSNLGEIVHQLAIKKPKIKLHFNEIKLDLKAFKNNYKHQKIVLVSDYVKRLQQKWLNNEWFDVLNEYEPAIMKTSKPLQKAHQTIKKSDNFLFLSGFSTTFVELELISMKPY